MQLCGYTSAPCSVSPGAYASLLPSMVCTFVSLFSMNRHEATRALKGGPEPSPQTKLFAGSQLVFLFVLN